MSDYLSSELMMEILARLPVRTLLQIRCVCKSWCSLISGDNFVTFRLNRTTQLNNINNTHLLLIRHFTDYDADWNDQHFSLYLDNESLTRYHLNVVAPYLNILGSCNGLVCLNDHTPSDTDLVYLWNPTIAKCVFLPEPRISFTSHHPYKPTRALGYGFDSTTNDHKVVRIAYVCGGPEVDIYSLKEGCWRQISADGDIPNIQFEACNAFVNGAIHWLCEGDDHCPCIVSFNLGTEVFSLMELPRSLGQACKFALSVGAFQGSLCVFHNYCYDDEVSIWVMKQYGVVESWTNVFDYSNLVSELDGNVKVLGLRRNGEILLTNDEETFSFDIKAQKQKSLGIRGEDGDDPAFGVSTYTESLVLIDKVNGGFGEPTWSSQLQAL